VEPEEARPRSADNFGRNCGTSRDQSEQLR
jgi:hypothetical protein